MRRIQFYPSTTLAGILDAEAKKNGVSVSAFVTDLLNDYYGLTIKNAHSVTQLTTAVFKEVEEYVKLALQQANGPIHFSLYSASQTYRQIDMTSGKKPSTVRASIGRSFAGKIGAPPFTNIKKHEINGVQQLSSNNALEYEAF